MLGFLLSVFRLVRFLMSGPGAIAVENTALRLQLAAFQRKRKRPVLTSIDRLGWAVSYLERPAHCLGLRPAGHGRPVAAGALSQVLGTPVQGETPTTRQAGDGCGDSPADRTVGGCQSAVACAEDSRGIEDARHRDLRADGFPNARKAQPAADSDLEEVSSQPPQSAGVD